MIGRVAEAVRAAAIRARQLAVLQRSGIVDLRRPDRVIRTMRTVRRLGPIASGVRVGAAVHGDRTAIIDRDGSVTYRELEDRTDELARQWASRGVGAGDGIAVLCRDHRGLVEAMIATAKLGATLVLLNTGFSARQLADVAARETVTAIVADAEFDGLLVRVGDGVRRLDGVSRPGATIPPPPVSGPPPTPERQGDLVLLTGGTTGTPKGAPRKVESAFAAAQFLDRVPLRPTDRMLLCAPLFHGTALSQFILALNLGATVILHGRFDAVRASDEIDRYRCSVVVLVPTMLSRMLAIPGGNGHPTLRIVFTAGAALAPALGNRAIEVFGPVLYNYYGCTETGTASIATPQDWTRSPGTVGRSPVGVRVRLFDEHGHPVTGPERAGIIHVGNAIAFSGYSGGGSKTVVGGLMSTGDVGHRNADGLLFVDGRADDMVVSGGENVYPGEVEDALHGHPGVLDVAVTGVPDDDFGQRLAAAVVRRSEGVTADDLRAHVRTELARFKVPRDVFFVDEIPRTPTGKLDRRGMARLVGADNQTRTPRDSGDREGIR